MTQIFNKIRFTSDIYKEYRDSTPFTLIKFFLVFMGSLIYSLAIFFIPLIAFKYGIADEEGMVRSITNIPSIYKSH
jgi:hypothetical protein